jgi:hypothetical protein
MTDCTTQSLLFASVDRRQIVACRLSPISTAVTSPATTVAAVQNEGRQEHQFRHSALRP